MSWHVTARRAAQRAGLDPRFLRRLRWIRKTRAVLSAGQPLRRHARFVLADPEPDNFTYDLANLAELARWVALVADCEPAEAERLVGEPGADSQLTARLRSATAGRWLWSKPAPPFGKRLGWYAIARVLEPELIVETGVHDGLGSLLLLHALERNDAAGRLVSFDINPASGWLVGSDPRWELRIEAASDGLPALLARSPSLGLFIHDSLHTYANEHAELSIAAAHLAPGGVLISDNAHATSALRDVCGQFGLTYHEFRELPRNHFYGGGIVGAGWRERSTAA